MTHKFKKKGNRNFNMSISTIAKGKHFELLVFEKLQQVNIESRHIGGRGDRGIDIKGKFFNWDLIIQCKNYTSNMIGEYTELLSYI